MAISEKNTRTQITLPKTMKAELENYAAEDGRSFNNFVVNILSRACEEIRENRNPPGKVTYIFRHK